MGIIIRYGVLVYGMACYYTVWGVSIRDVVLVYGMGCSYTGWGVSIRDGMLVNVCCVTFWDGMLVYGWDVSKRD